jgi:hypothetical protein
MSEPLTSNPVGELGRLRWLETLLRANPMAYVHDMLEAFDRYWPTTTADETPAPTSKPLYEWTRRAASVLPLIPRNAGTDLAAEVSWLLSNEPSAADETEPKP